MQATALHMAPDSALGKQQYKRTTLYCMFLSIDNVNNKEQQFVCAYTTDFSRSVKLPAHQGLHDPGVFMLYVDEKD